MTKSGILQRLHVRTTYSAVVVTYGGYCSSCELSHLILQPMGHALNVVNMNLVAVRQILSVAVDTVSLEIVATVKVCIISY